MNVTPFGRVMYLLRTYQRKCMIWPWFGLRTKWCRTIIPLHNPLFLFISLIGEEKNSNTSSKWGKIPFTLLKWGFSLLFFRNLISKSNNFQTEYRTNLIMLNTNWNALKCSLSCLVRNLWMRGTSRMACRLLSDTELVSKFCRKRKRTLGFQKERRM